MSRVRLEDRFPTAHARRKADEAIDALPVSAPMTEYLDTWVRVYLEAGGVWRGRS